MAHAFGRVNCIQMEELDEKLLRHPNSFIIDNGTNGNDGDGTLKKLRFWLFFNRKF